tara:strand:- start:373 stop:777 length:405 start_codon:yes stop_codon:yes gene_type:complete
MIGRLNHVAIAVTDIQQSIQTYSRMLGAEVGELIEQPEHNVLVCFVTLPNTKIELITPLRKEGPLTNFLKKNPSGGIHHICYEVRNINDSRDKLVRLGAKIIGSDEPKIGAHGKPVLFLHPNSFDGTLIELEEA